MEEVLNTKMHGDYLTDYISRLPRGSKITELEEVQEYCKTMLAAGVKVEFEQRRYCYRIHIEWENESQFAAVVAWGIEHFVDGKRAVERKLLTTKKQVIW